MTRRIRNLGIALVALLAIGFAASEIWPERAAKLMLAGLYASAGLQERTVTISQGPVHYLDGGEGEAVVFLHGVYALKEHWIDMSRPVSGPYRTIILDLPGFGENPRFRAEDYDFDKQSDHVYEALDQIGIDTFHMVANSMGAQIGATMATAQPDRVQTLTFVGSPIGVRSPVASDMEQALATGHKPLVVTTPEEYDARMAWLFPKTPFLPRPIARTWRKTEVSHAESNVGIWETLVGSEVAMLEQVAPGLNMPSLIIWCDQDRIFHFSGAEVLDQALPNSELIMPEGCGHLPMLDRARATGNDVLEFLNRH